MPTPTPENNNATASRTDKAVVCNALVSRLLASAEVERSFGNTHANLLADAANEITRLRDALREALTLPKLYDNLRTIADDERRCERRRSHLDVAGDGAFGIAVASDERALEWQKLHAEAKTIKERVGAIITRCALLANDQAHPTAAEREVERKKNSEL
jgi:uncharacterized membrane protein YccC